MNSLKQYWFLMVVTILFSSMSLVQAKNRANRGRGSRTSSRGRSERKEWKNINPFETEKENNWQPPGLKKRENEKLEDNRPFGWSQGKKKGWGESDIPVGLNKKGGQLPSGLKKSTTSGVNKHEGEKNNGVEKGLDNEKKNMKKPESKVP